MRATPQEAGAGSLAAAGHDGMIYRVKGGEWHAIALEPGQVRIRNVIPTHQGKVDNLVDDWYRRQERTLAKHRNNLREHEATLRSVEAQVIEANGSARQAWRFHKQNQQRLDQLERQVAREWKSIDKQQSQLMFDEIHARERVEEAYDVAARIEREDMVPLMDQYMQTVDEYERTALRTAAENAEAKAMSVRLQAAYEQQVAELMEAIAEHEERVVQAYQKIKNDEKLKQKARKAVEIAFTLLADEVSADCDSESDSGAEDHP